MTAAVAKLDQYLTKRDVTRVAFARQVGCVPSRLTQIMNDGDIPSFRLMVEIEKATRGWVKVQDWK